MVSLPPPPLVSLLLALSTYTVLGLHSRHHRDANNIRLRRFTSQSPLHDFHPLLAAPPNASGVRMRMFPRGVQALNQVAANLLATQLPRILIPNIEHRLPNDQGVLHISRVRMSRFKRAAVHNVSMKSPSRVVWEMKDMNIGLIGDLSGQTNIVVPLDLTGEAEILAEGLNLRLESILNKSADGSARVQTVYCISSIQGVEVINHNGGLFGLAVTVFKQGISDNVRTLLERVICKEVQRYIDEDLNQKLAEVQTKSPLTQAIRLNAIKSKELLPVKGKAKGFTVNSFFGKDFGSDFFIDYRLKESPACGDDTIDLGSSGEISYLGRGETPFGPVPLALPTPEGDEMLAVVLSDFVLNSLLYHAFRQRRLRVYLDSSNPGAASILKTDCADSFCFGDLIPQLAETYPNRTLAMLFSATRAPAVLFTERNGGLITMGLGGILALFLEDGGRKKQIAMFDVDVIAAASVNTEDKIGTLQKGNVKGNISLDKFELSKKYGELQITKEELDDIALLCAQFIEGMLNELLATGFPLPVPQVVKLSRLSLSVHNRRMVILTDFTVDERRLSKIASAGLFPFIPAHPNAPSIASLLEIEPEIVPADAPIPRVTQRPQRDQPQRTPVQAKPLLQFDTPPRLHRNPIVYPPSQFLPNLSQAPRQLALYRPGVVYYANGSVRDGLVARRVALSRR